MIVNCSMCPVQKCYTIEIYPIWMSADRIGWKTYPQLASVTNYEPRIETKTNEMACDLVFAYLPAAGYAAAVFRQNDEYDLCVRLSTLPTDVALIVLFYSWSDFELQEILVTGANARRSFVIWWVSIFILILRLLLDTRISAHENREQAYATEGVIHFQLSKLFYYFFVLFLT